jgi:hypothetical protein
MLSGLTSMVTAAAAWMRPPWLRGERGQSVVEYVLLLTLIVFAGVLLLQWSSFTTALNDALTSVENAFGQNGAATP